MTNHNTYISRIVMMLTLMITMGVGSAWGDTWDGTITNNAANKFAENGITLQTPGQPNSATNPYTIDNAKEFAYFMRVVQSSWTGRASSYYWKLTTDIDLKNIAWTYGTNNAGSFQGHFDGDGHTISNVSIAISGNSNHGLFPTIQGASATNVAEVKNLIIDGITFTSDASRAGTTRVGALAGYVKQANITNVDVKNVTINYNNTITADNRIGGAIGWMENNTILDDVDVTGVTATFQKTTTGLYFGGVVGYASGTANTSSMVNCDAKTIKVNHQSNITGTTYMGGLVGNANTSLNVINNNTVSGVVGQNDGKGFDVTVAGTVSTFDVGGLLGYTKGGAHEIKNNKASNISITVNGATAGGSIYLSGFIGYAVGIGSPSTRKTIQGNTVSNPSVTMNGAVGHTLYMGGFLGCADAHTNVLNNKVVSPQLSLKEAVNIATYVGGAVGAQNNYTTIDGMYVNGGSITGPSADKKVLNGKTFFVGGALGIQNASGTVDYQPNKFKNVVVSGMTINLAHYIPSSYIKDHKFAVGGIAGAVNAPNQDSKGNRGMPENLVSKGVNIYAPFASTSPTVALFSNASLTYDTYSHEKITTIDAIERSKVASWLYTDYKLGLNKTILAQTNTMETATANGKVRRNYASTATVTGDATDSNLEWLTVDDNTFQKANRYLDHVRDSKTVLWWTRSDNNSSYANTDVEQTLYPQSNSTTANSATNQYNYYWYFYQGVANARYVTEANANAIIAGIDANITEAAKETPLTLAITNDKENKRGFDARTITVTPSAAVSSYEWYVNGEKLTETSTSISLKPDWMWGKGIVVNALDGSSKVIASQSYVLPIGVFKTKNGDALRSNIKERGTSTNPYILDSEEDLRQLSYLSTCPRTIYFEGLDKVSSDGKYAYHSMLHYNRAYYELGADITLHGEFTPISHVGTSADGENGTYHLNYFFQGVFDGKGHKISGLQVTWDAGHYNGADANMYYGLFGILGHSTPTAKWQDGSNSNTVVKNLVIDGATFTHDTNNTSFYYNNGNSGNSNNCMVGVLAGIVSANTTVQNIEIRNSSITDAGSSEYKLATRGLYVGGAIGSVQYDNKTVTTVPADTKIEHIAAQVDITLTHSAFVNPKPSKGEEVSKINAGGIIGRFIASSSTQADAQKVMPKYTFYSGRINAPKAWISPVLAYTRFSANTDYAYFSKIWEGNNNAPGTQLTIEGAQYYKYYIGDASTAEGQKLITASYPANNCLWDARSLVYHLDASENANTYDPKKYQGVNYGASFVDSNKESLQSLNQNTTDDFNWKWSDTGFPTLTTDPYVGAFLTRSGNTFTANMTGAVATSYKWAASFDGNTWHDLTATGNTYTAPVSLKPKYVVAFVNTDYRTRPEVVESADNVCDPKIVFAKSGENSNYTVNMNYTIDMSEFQHTYQWLKSDNKTVWEGQTGDNITLTPAQVTEGGDLIWCTINVTELDEIIATYNISYGNSVIFVDATNGNDGNDGKTPATAVKTIDVANGKLKTVAQGGTWDNNFIVVIGTLNYNTSFTSRGECPATITGKWDDIPANVAVIDLKKNDKESANPGDGPGKTAHNNYISADTKFENLVFWTSTQQDNALFECHGHDVWFGKGIRMKNFRELSDNHGNLVEDRQSNIPELSIILTASNPDEAAITRYTAGRTKPQVLTIESGHYGRILGGRFISNFFAKTENTAHAILGTAKDPLWAVINVDIDKNNDEYSADDSPVKYTCDINCIIAGLTDGTVYGDYEINLRGGNVRYIVGGNQGNGVLSGSKTYTPEGGSSGNFGQWPNSSFFGRTVINVEQNPDLKPVILNNLYAGGLGRKADKEAAVVDMYMYGRTEVNLKSGTIQGNVYGGGAGGVIGVNPWDAHVPYDATGISDDTNTAIYKGVQYGDSRVTDAWSSKEFGTSALVDVALHNPDGKGGYTKELFNLANSSTTVNVTGGTIGTLDNEGKLVAGTGNVYGGGNGYVSNLPVNLAMQGIGSVFGTTNVNISGDPTIYGNVYGGSMGDETFFNQQNVYKQTITHIAETNGTVNLYITGTEEKCPVIAGNIYGAGKGIGSEGGEEYSRIATTGNATLGNQYKSEINVTIDLPEIEAHKYAGKIYGGGQMGMVDGTTNVNIKHGLYSGQVFGGGFGEENHQDKAKVNGNTNVNITGGKLDNDVYGGGDLGMVSATANVNIEGGELRGKVFGGGNKAIVGTSMVNPTKQQDETNEAFATRIATWATANGTTVTMNNKEASVYGEIFGGGNEANVEGNASVTLYAGNFAGNIFGGGNGVLDNNGTVTTSADVTGNTLIYIAQDEGGQNLITKKDNFSINVIWDKKWDAKNKQFLTWENDKSSFYEEPVAPKKIGKFLDNHNIYGGGNAACKVGSFDGEGNLIAGTGKATVTVLKGMTPYELLKTTEWKESYNDNKNPHFYVFGGGYGVNTTVGSTDVTVNVEGEYGEYTAEVGDGSDEQLAKPMRKRAKSRAGDLPVDVDVFDNSKGIPNFTVLGALGGGYAGIVTGDTKVTIDGKTFLHRVYGGGFGDPNSTANNTTGQVYGNTDVHINGAHTYGDVFGGGAGVESLDTNNDDIKDIDFPDVARVLGTASVTVADDARIYGAVYGGGDMACVGSSATNLRNYATSVTSTSIKSSDTWTYTHSNHQTFVNILGGDIFGEVYGGGRGVKKAEANDYTKVGRVEGNTLLHIVSSVTDDYGKTWRVVPEATDGAKAPYVWNRIYGGCAYGIVDGNTMVHVEGGMLGLNIFGGGYGDMTIEGDKTDPTSGASTASSTLDQVLGKKDTNATFANILGNTKVQIDGGSWVWNQRADINGNITTWLDATNKVVDDLEGFKKLVVQIQNAKTEEELRQIEAVKAINENFFKIDTKQFSKNHNIFGGGNRACFVGTYSDTDASSNVAPTAPNTGTSEVIINHSPITKIKDADGNTIDMLDHTTAAGLCWYLGINSISHPQFSVFGAGYGANTKVYDAIVKAQPGVQLNPDGLGYASNKYINEEADLQAYVDFDSKIVETWNNVSQEDKEKYYGLTDGNEGNTFLRYRSSQLAWSMGAPNFTFMDIHGGGFSGYVVNDAKVEADCQLTVRNIFGAGLGSKPFSTDPVTVSDANNSNLGQVGHDASVFFKSGIVSLNVYGGGAGVESKYLKDGKLYDDAVEGGTLVDLPNIARVVGKTTVDIYGENLKMQSDEAPALKDKRFERTVIFGSVYGGGDVAIVGKSAASPVVLTGEEPNYTTTVTVRGGSLQAQIYAGGKGRLADQCSIDKTNPSKPLYGYKKLGAVYGNTHLIVDHADASYPYTDYPNTKVVPVDPITGKPNVSPHIWNRIYGGCENGTVYGNTLVEVLDGSLGHNVFGGGFGDDGTSSGHSAGDNDTPDTPSLAAMGRAAATITSADVTGNTNIFVRGGEMELTSYWHPDTRTWEPATKIGGTTYSPQYNPTDRKFKINHNIYGGGNLACRVKGNSYITMTKGMLKTTTPVLPGQATGEGSNYNFFATNEWHEVYDKVGSPHFAVFGGGYGENTYVSNSNLNINLGTTPSPHEEPLKGEEYKHFVSAQSVIDIVGGGYSGKIEGEKPNEDGYDAGVTTVNVGAGTFARRVFGGGYYNSARQTNVNIAAVDCHDIFGGGLLGDIHDATNVNIGSESANNSAIYVHGNIYGGNDVSGYINLVDKGDDGKDVEFVDNEKTEPGDNEDYKNGTHITIRGGHIYGNVYGAGNGDYRYALGKNGETQVTVNEHYKLEGTSNEYDLVYTVPMRSTMISSQSASPAMTIVNINSWRPLTNKVTIDLAGTGSGEGELLRIDGNVYGGGNSATVLTARDGVDSQNYVGGVKFRIGNHMRIGGVYLGSDGDQLFVNASENPFLQDFQDINSLSLHDAINWKDDPSNHGISTAYLPTGHDQRPLIYPHLLDLYFQPVEMAVQPQVKWGTSDNVEDVIIGTFCCGGNRGNMNVAPEANGNIVDIKFPTGLIITDKIIGGCNRANYTYNNTTTGETTVHTGGYLLGKSGTDKPLINLTVLNQFQPKVQDGKYVGANVYGGCYETGSIRGDVKIDFRSNMLNGLDKNKLLASNNAGVATCNVYGAGYGMESYVVGNVNLLFGNECKPAAAKSSTPGSGQSALAKARKDAPADPIVMNNVSANFVYGGGQQGNVIGNTTVKILNGHVNKSVTGGSYSGYQYGSTQVLVGYPTYYVCKTSGVYNLKRTDQATDNLGRKNEDADHQPVSYAIKQTINLLKGDIVSEQVYDAIKAYDANQISTAFEATPKEEKPSDYNLEWNDIDINIDEAVYGGGYSLSSGSSVAAGNTTVLKYTNNYNVNDNLEASELSDIGGTTAGFGGNTTMLIADHPAATEAGDGAYRDKEHITVSSQVMLPATLAAGTDLYGYYYKGTDDKYHYIYQAGTYFKNGNMPQDAAKLSDGVTTDYTVYQFDAEGGIFGDGHLSYAEGFRNAEITGYGYAEHTVAAPKYINTFQRMDMLRLTDNCFTLLGARDYTVNEISSTPYSVARVGEIQMISSIDAETKALSDAVAPRARNFMGFSNNIHYIGAVYSNVGFGDKWHNHSGTLGAAGDDMTGCEGGMITRNGQTYQEVKQNFINDYYGAADANKKAVIFQQRNDGTAKNMIGIASGYALKIQNIYETYEGNKMKENIYYGPIHGVIEMNLIDVREDEGGGYVYADNIHSDKTFLETTGNFVFPYRDTDGRYVVDDCFTSGYDQSKGSDGSATEDVHYWYVTGFNYFYNAHITGYTYKTDDGVGINFDLNNADGLMKLSGAKAGQRPIVYSVTWRSGHEDGYQCDLERSARDDADGHDVYNKYWLGISAAEKGEYAEAAAAYYKIPFGGKVYTENEQQNPVYMQGELPSDLGSDANIGIRLHDQMDNSGSQYYQDHLSKPCEATIILTLPAYDGVYNSENPEVNRKDGYIGISNFYTRTVDSETHEVKYNEVPGSTEITIPNEKETTPTYYYYNSVLNRYAPIDDLREMYTRNGSDYTKITAGSTLDRSDNKINYYKTHREYTYTIYLTIDYVEGPGVQGNITINNCALPGELIKLSTENVIVDGADRIPPTGSYWRIGRLNAEGTDFQDPTPWTITSNTNLGYDTYKQGDGNDKKHGVFVGCDYNTTENALYIPAYYFMNGYGVQYGFSVRLNGQDILVQVPMKRLDSRVITDTLVVHNYHMMDPQSDIKDFNLHLAEAIARAKEFKDYKVEKAAYDANHEGEAPAAVEPFADPRIYIFDEKDMTAFPTFLNDIGKSNVIGGVEKVKIGTEELVVPRYGESAQFVLQNNLAVPSSWAGTSTFAGIFHGNGHVLTGLGKSASFLGTNNGHIYNLGLASGKIANTNAAISDDYTAGKYHCCFEYNDNTDKHKVYRMDGTSDDTYTDDDFRYGKVAYDLNQYYLDSRLARHPSDPSTPITSSTAAAAKYVEDYYANGDYQYACRRDVDTKQTTGINYLRTGKGEKPGYGTTEAHHDVSHAIDKARAVGYHAAVAAVEEVSHLATEDDVTAGKATAVGEKVIDTPAVPAQPESRTGDYLPLFNAAQQTEGDLGLTELMNDYLFWGQNLQQSPETYPTTIESHQNSAMINRVWRAVGYHGDTHPTAYLYNAYNYNTRSMGTYVHYPRTTAVDFTCDADPVTPAYTVGMQTVGTGQCFYPPFSDTATLYSSFAKNPSNDITRNLLVYTPADDVDRTTDVHDVVNTRLGYNGLTSEGSIQGHHVVDKSTSYLHLVERTYQNEDATGAACSNNDFHCPIPFTVTNRAWYTRRPRGYAELNSASWEGLCLPFAVNHVQASHNGEISHFYGATQNTESTGANREEETKTNIGHEYWLRGMTSVEKDNTGIVTANFSRPGDTSDGCFSADDASVKAAVKGTYTYFNNIFPETYGAYGYVSQGINGGRYETERTFTDYQFQACNTPYIVAFPGSAFCEFDLSGNWSKNKIAPGVKQTVTFNYYVDDSSLSSHVTYPTPPDAGSNINASTHVLTIPVTPTEIKTEIGLTGADTQKYSHIGIFAAKTDVSGIDEIHGSEFEAAGTVVLPFRTYMTMPAAGGAKRSVIIGASNMSLDQPDIEFGDPETGEGIGNHLVIYSVNHDIVIESTYAVTLNVHTVTGHLNRTINVQPGKSRYTDFPPGIYIINGQKLVVR